MPSKDKGPLQTAQREGDELKRKVDNITQEAQSLLDDTTIPERTTKLSDLYRESISLKETANSLHKKVSALRKGDEPIKVPDFDRKKKDEVKRVDGLRGQLEKLISKLEPDEVEEDYFRKVQEKGGAQSATETDGTETSGEESEEETDEGESETEGESEEDSDDESEEEDSDEEGSEEEQTTTEVKDHTLRQWEALSDFKGEEEGDLNFKKGDILNIVETQDDGWWMAEDKNGKRGLVPSTYLQVYAKFPEVHSPEVGEKEDLDASKASGKSLWRKVSKAFTETSVTDVLSAMGGIPSGFRHSTLHKLLEEDETYTTGHYIYPKLSESHLSFRDLHWNPTDCKIRSKTVRIQRTFTLWNCKAVPDTGSALDVKSRHVRVALFDGVKVLSNIHTVQAKWLEKEPKTWTFNPRVQGMLPSILDGECFVRSNNVEQNIGLLFELGVTYVRTKTGEQGELSCGWAHLKLFDDNGSPIANKSYDCTLNGGTPYEKGVEVDPAVSRTASGSRFKSLLTANKQPHLIVKVGTPNKERKDILDMLPDTLVSSVHYAEFTAYYRQILADTLLRDRLNMYTADLIHSPVLAQFPKAIMQSDIMDALRSVWGEKMKTLKKANKRDSEQMKALFTQVFMETAYALLFFSSLPEYKWWDMSIMDARWKEISKFLKKNQQKGGLASLLSSDSLHEPFNIAEVSFDLLSTNCTT
ncbi:NPHP1 [Branchiostoma lanceolatum]|uniref:NPHP1 protein n=1 Tax=Branchiostoma lanceolatum TaxID=7740 RepID=A0A8K0EU20_BRALA|nr:NPHP1 [Branchiostoma lanceolatum]